MSSTTDRPSGAAQLRRDADTHRVIDGRRWRVSDPALDDTVRQHLVDELMDARRAVKAGLAASDQDATQLARDRVHAAKVALGERGPTWWEPMVPDDIDSRVRAFLRAIGDRLGHLDEDDARRHLRLDPRVR